MLQPFSIAATERLRLSSMTAGLQRVWIQLLVLFITCALCGCTQIRQTAELWSEQRQLTQRAREAQEQGDVSQAADLLTQAVNADPKNCETRLELSELLMEHGSLDAATQHLQSIVEQNPEDPRGYVRLAQILVLQNRGDEAEPLLSTALEIDPGNPNALMLFAQWLEHRGESRQALDTYYRAIPLLSNPVEAELRIAAIKLRSGQTTPATSLLRSIVDNTQACPAFKAEAYSLLGHAYVREQRWHDAALAFEAGLKIEPQTSLVADWQHAAEAHARAGEWDDASRCSAMANQFRIASSRGLNTGPGGMAQVGYETSRSQPPRVMRTPYFAARP